MRTFSLITLLLASANAALAAPCNILPYVNQCQGSNYWPKPAGWGSYSGATCQPTPPTYTPGYYGYSVNTTSTTCTNRTGDSEAEAAGNCCASRPSNIAAAYPSCQLFRAGEAYNSSGSMPNCDFPGAASVLRIWSGGLVLAWTAVRRNYAGPPRLLPVA